MESNVVFPEKFGAKQASQQWRHDVAKCLIECAVLSYKPEEVVRKQIAHSVEHFEWFEAEGRVVDTQAFGCVLRDDIILAFRGTEGLRDVISDVTLTRSTLMDFNHQKKLPGVKAHDGFRRCLDSIWSDESNSRKRARHKTPNTVREFLLRHAKGKRIWLTGHSLGGAIATIAAARIEAPGSPLRGSVDGLFTIGSPRALSRKGAKALMAALGDDKIYRIVKSIDPVPLVPRVRYKHVSGTRAFITSKGDLVIGSSKFKRWAESLLSWFRAVEDALGSALPGQHKGVSAFISDHSSEGYFSSVKNWNENNRQTGRDILGMMMPPIKIALGGLAGGGALSSYWPMIKSFLGIPD